MRRGLPWPRHAGQIVAMLVTAILATSGMLTAPLAGAKAHTTSAAGAVASPGCATSSPETTGVTTTAYAAAGDQGSYIANVPTTATATHPVPLIVDLHGWSEPAAVQVLASGWGAFGDTHGFITITPQVTYAVPHWNTTLGSKDLAYLSDLVTHVEQTHCIDERRIFFTGYSDGAFMTSAVACQMASRVAAVGTVAGIQDIAGCKPSRRVPVVAFHGTADPYVSYLGGLGKSALNLPAADGSGKTLGQELKGHKAPTITSIPFNTAAWAKRNGCRPHPTITSVASGVSLIHYDCAKDATVELYRITGGGHAWPGSPFTRNIASVVGFTTFKINADQIMWKFFQEHPLPAGGVSSSH